MKKLSCIQNHAKSLQEQPEIHLNIINDLNYGFWTVLNNCNRHRKVYTSLSLTPVLLVHWRLPITLIYATKLITNVYAETIVSWHTSMELVASNLSTKPYPLNTLRLGSTHLCLLCASLISVLSKFVTSHIT